MITKGKYHRFHTCCPIHAGCQDPESTDIQLRIDNRRKQYSKPHETSHAASCSGQGDDLVITLGPHWAAALVLGDLLGHPVGPGIVVVVVVSLDVVVVVVVGLVVAIVGVLREDLLPRDLPASQQLRSWR